ESIGEILDTVLELMPLRKNWKPVDDLIKLGGLKLLVTLIPASLDWQFNGKTECTKCALDVLIVASVLPKTQMALLEGLQIDIAPYETCGIRVLLNAAEGFLTVDSDIQCAALQVLINCCCGPLQRIGSSNIQVR